MSLTHNLDHQEDELEEWLFFHVPVNTIISANAAEFQNLKNMLVTHLGTAAREYVKFARGDSTSTAKPIVTFKNPKELSEEDRGRMERKKARQLARMSPETRERLRRAEAEGHTVIMM